MLIRLIGTLIFLTCTVQAINMAQLNKTIDNAMKNSWDQLVDNEWSFPSSLGSWFMSEYYFELLALNITNSKFNQSFFTELLLGTQLPDGSWEQVHENNFKTGILDPTVMNYWYLKSVGVDINSEEMQKARDWILAEGGIEQTQTMTKFKLAAFGQYNWEDLFYAPLFFFKKEGFYFNTYAKDQVAQWIYPHMTALAYLRYQRVNFAFGQDILELWVNPPSRIHVYPRLHTSEPDESLLNLVEEMLILRQPKGSFGAYTISTLLSMLALKDFQQRWPNLKKDIIDESLENGFNFVEFNYFNDKAPYQGTLDDGRWWDTILVAWGLLEAGEDTEKLVPIVDNMITKAVQKFGGIAYGFDFEYAPDADDTGLLLVVLSFFGDRYQDQIELNKRWLLGMQNLDGGYPAFDTNKVGNFFFKKVFEIIGLANSAEIFDPSSPDVTTHIMEGFALTGMSKDDQNIQKAIKYLKETQSYFGSWEARWGINYIYSVGCIIPGLSRIGYNLSEQWVERSIKWLQSKQNEDGGFGETTLSYNYPIEHNGRGKSTDTQTAWALLALLEVKDIYSVEETIEKAVQYLLQDFKAQGNKFFDTSVVGTGHRGLLYLQYPSYAYSFPLVALARYRKIMLNEYVRVQTPLKVLSSDEVQTEFNPDFRGFLDFFN